ncbi:hypothetical protein BU17DRAFT_90855 [Hysterangium stoloniferum]|nr:hypothetical protein BU17DRAFT_90855 [Hysterangium stoloniferum]
MPSDLPQKLWCQIIKQYIPLKRDLRNLSLVNKVLHDLTLPHLFQNLHFLGMLPNLKSFVRRDHPEKAALKAMSSLYLRCEKRIEQLLSHPHILLYVKSVYITGWSQLSSFLEEDPDMWQHSMYSSAVDRWNTAYHRLAALIPEASSMKTLIITNSPITLQIQPSFFSCPQLDTLMLISCDLQVDISNTPRRDVVTRLTNFIYELDNSSPDHTPAAIKQIVKRSALSLTHLDIPMESLIGVAAILCATKHSLIHLNISSPFNVNPTSPSHEVALYNLLDTCQNLESLSLSGWIGEAFPNLCQHIPTKLKCVSGTVSLLRQMISKRPVASIHIQYSALDPIIPTSFLLEYPPTAIVRKLTMDCAKLRPNVLEGVASAFPQLTHLTIRFVRGYIGDRSTAIVVCLYPVITSFSPVLRAAAPGSLAVHSRLAA